jgi:hypothetical protein
VTSPELPSGWYRSAEDPSQDRYWNGNEWTSFRPSQVVSGHVAPGWYADPQAPGRQRYWDGARWTDHMQAAPVAQPGVGAGPFILAVLIPLGGVI